MGAAMLLDDYAKERELSDAEIGAELDCTAECVRLWRKRRRIPRPEAMARITAWSDGAVTANDFFGLEDGKAA
jgi:hypothetical protein